jgi:hypothetical protein
MILCISKTISFLFNKIFKNLFNEIFKCHLEKAPVEKPSVETFEPKLTAENQLNKLLRSPTQLNAKRPVKKEIKAENKLQQPTQQVKNNLQVTRSGRGRPPKNNIQSSDSSFTGELRREWELKKRLEQQQISLATTPRKRGRPLKANTSK